MPDFSLIEDSHSDGIKAAQIEVLRTFDGSFGEIRILKPNREINEYDEDIHSLIARILIHKAKQKARGDPSP